MRIKASKRAGEWWEWESLWEGGAFRRIRRSGVRLGVQSEDQGLRQVLLTSTSAHMAQLFLRVPRMALLYGHTPLPGFDHICKMRTGVGLPHCEPRVQTCAFRSRSYTKETLAGQSRQKAPTLTPTPSALRASFLSKPFGEAESAGRVLLARR